MKHNRLLFLTSIIMVAFVVSACGRTQALISPTPTPVTEFAPQPTPVRTSVTHLEREITSQGIATSTTITLATSSSAQQTARPSGSPSPAISSAKVYDKDALGRVLGGAFPILNYSPGAVTGKPCGRVTQWGQNTVKLGSGVVYGVVDNPCVIQNALDDYVIAAGADPQFLSPEQMKAVAPLYKADPLWSKLYPDWWRRQFIEDGKFTNIAYYACDKPMYRLMNVTAQTPTFNNNSKTQQLYFALVSEKFQPFSCVAHSFRDNAPSNAQPSIIRTEADLKGPDAFPAFAVYALWNEQPGTWQFQGASPGKAGYSLDFVKGLYSAGSVKPW